MTTKHLPPIAIDPIGIVHSCFKDKFGIPRQPQLAPSSYATIELFSPFNSPLAWRDLTTPCYIWILFYFHKTQLNNRALLVRPPRLGGEKKIGIFATRSPYHPNRIGQSVVLLKSIITEGTTISLEINQHDLLDKTPVLDIKPYIDQYDKISSPPSLEWMNNSTFTNLNVEFSSQAQKQINNLKLPVHFINLITEILQADPRTGAQKKESKERIFKINLDNIDICWQVQQTNIVVLDLIPCN